MLNPFFLNGSQTEQGLLQDLINESIKMYGVDVHYIPRQYITQKTIIKEVIESQFNNAYPLEAYIENYEGYEGAGTLLTKFGVQPYTDLNLIISRERYSNYISPLIKNLPNVKLSSRPKEGDLIYFPLGDRLFEIKFVEHEQPFYQLKKNYVYVLKCELFRYEDEIIDTGISNIDDNVESQGYIQTYNMIGIGSTATAVTSLVYGGVRSVTVTNRGEGYNGTPIVGFSSPQNGVAAVGVATMISGIVDLCQPDGTLYRVQGVEITNPGFGYTVAPSVAFYGGSPSKTATATATIGNGIVGIITITNGGGGYATPPPVSFVGVSSITAQARSIITNGSVSEIRIINSGLDYISTPQIVIGGPNVVGIGTYRYNEIVMGTTTGTTARVKSWNAVTRKLELSNISGDFAQGEIIMGSLSQAQYKLQLASVYEMKDPFAQNSNIQTEGSSIIDFSESNPFGTP
jgi:hypothetical protein